MTNNVPPVIRSPRDGEEMRLVWHDEFDGDKLDGEKWILYDRMYGDRAIHTFESERNVKVENGMLVMRSWKEADGTYSTHKSVTSTGRMSYLYGYAEVRARFPFVPGSFPSFWLQSAPQHRTAGYMTEVDVMEPYFYGYLESALHRWFLNESPIGFGSAYADDWYEPERYTIPGFEEYRSFWNYFDKKPELTEAQKAAVAKFNSEFHTYGFGWTENEMYFTMDGAIVGQVDLTTLTAGGRRNITGNPEDPRFKAVEKVTDVNGFRYDAMFINFTNWISTGKGFRYSDYVANDDTRYPLTFEVDYVRLYQKPGEGKLFDDRGNGLTQEQASKIPQY